MKKGETTRLLLMFLLLYSVVDAQDFHFGNVYSNGQPLTPAPAGSVMIMYSNSCPTGYAENAALDGIALEGTVAAHSNQGTTGGSDTITPTVATLTAAAQAFTGTPFSSVINHTHAVTVTYQAQGGTTAATTGTHSMTSTATGGSARSLASGDVVSATTANPAGGVASITPAGTNGTSSVTGTLNNFDNRQAFVRVIFCVKS